MSKNITFYLDDIPEIISPLHSQDHNLNMIYSFIHKPIFTRFNNKFSSEIIDDLSVNTHLKLKVKENKYGVSARDIYKTLLFILDQKTLYASYLSFLVGVKEYLRNDSDLKSISLHYHDNVIEGTMYDNTSYLEVLSSIHFSPLKFENYSPIVTDGFGEYFIHTIEKNEILLKNKYNHNYIYFIVEKDEATQINNIKNTRDIAYTGLTSLKNDTLINNDVVKVKTNLEFRLKINSKLLMDKNIFNVLKNSILNEIYLNNSIDRVLQKTKANNLNDSLVLSNEDFVKISRYSNSLLLLYADYYPNEILIGNIVTVLTKLGLNIECNKKDFKNFLKSNFDSYDLIFDIIEPIVLNPLDKYISEIINIPNHHKKEYVNLLNRWIKSGYKNDFITRIDNFIWNHSTSIVIGKFNRHYLKSENAPLLIIDDLGIIISVGDIFNVENNGII